MMLDTVNEDQEQPEIMAEIPAALYAVPEQLDIVEPYAMHVRYFPFP
jgi:hypothetical protein